MTEYTVDQAFQLALQAHQGGRLQQAEQLYRQILGRQPRHAGAVHLLGIVAHQVGRTEIAADLFRQAIALRPDWPEAHSDLGVALYSIGRLDEAIAAYQRAVALKPDYHQARYNLGNALNDKGQTDEAIVSYRQAIALKPEYPEAYNNLGNALKDKGQLDEAIACYRQAIALKPGYAEAYGNLGRAQKDKGHLNEAIASYRRSIELRADYAEAWNNLGVALKDNGQLDEAVVCHRRAVALKPDMHEAHCNLGYVLRCTGHLDEAIASSRRAIALKPDYAEAHGNLGMALLLLGDYSQGWDEYEWRLKCKDTGSSAQRLTQPPWDGRPLKDATLLLHAEQGFGDTLLFIRYYSLAARRCGKIVIECQAELQRLIEASAGGSPVVVEGQPPPAFDAHCPLPSLPRIFGTTLESIPRHVPYLHADPEDAAAWKKKLAGDSNSLKVGLAWAGSKANTHDRTRSMPFSALTPLGRVPGMRFYSLQKGAAANKAGKIAARLDLINWTGDLKDFADTAALIANLDLVISVDTSVAHLAGAMGKPTWVLLSLVPDWRWLLEREDSPWYPTMRLFRQPASGDWDSVVLRVADSLNKLLNNKNAAP